MYASYSSGLASGRRSALSERVDEEVIRAVVEDFYSTAKLDPLLGPVFEMHVEDWAGHMATMRKFWVTVLLGERRYFGDPLAKHSGVPEMSAEHFRRWLAVFSDTLAKHCAPSDAMAWEATARRMGFAMSARLGLGEHGDLLP